MMKKNLLIIFIALIMSFVCNGVASADGGTKIVGGDLSLVPAYETAGDTWLDASGNTISDLITYVKNTCGWNAVRVRLFVDPSQDGIPATCQDLTYVEKLGKRIKDAGMYFLLDIHYSDTWADCSKQWIPTDWNMSDATSTGALAKKAYDYTKETLEAMVEYGAAPDYVQVGNEISYGMMWDNYTDQATGNAAWLPYSTYSTQWARFAVLFRNGAKAVRKVCPNAKIILHSERTASAANSKAVYDNIISGGLDAADFDIIGLSYYPFWHGTLTQLGTTISTLQTAYPTKDIQIVETAWLNGQSSYPSSPTYAASTFSWAQSPAGQKAFITDLIGTLDDYSNVTGLYYWQPEECGNGYGSTDDTKTVMGSWDGRGFWDLTYNAESHSLISSDAIMALATQSTFVPKTYTAVSETETNEFVNLDFEYGSPAGWTFDQTFTTQDTKTYDSSWMKLGSGTVMELWNSSATSGSIISQSCTVANGTYTVTVDGIAESGSVYLFANDDQETISSTAGTVSVTTTVTDGTLKIGIGSSGTGTTYTYFDNFTVTSSTPTLVTSLSLDQTSATVNVGSTLTLTPTALPSTATDKTVTWSSSDESVATVSSAGVVTGVKAGTATITATANDGSGKTATCEVTVQTVNTLYERGYSTAWSSDDLTGWTASTTDSKVSSSISTTNGLVLATTGSSSATSVAYSYTNSAIAPTVNTSILTLNAVWNPGNATGSTGKYSYLKFGDIEFRFGGSALSNCASVVIGGTTTNIVTAGGSNTYRNKDWNITLTINQATKEVSYSITGVTTASGTGTTAGTFSGITTGCTQNKISWGNEIDLKSISVTETLQPTANYTVKYMCGTEEIKTAETRSWVIGLAPSITDDDKVAIYSADNTKKYIYSSDDAASQTVASDGSTVVTVTFREASTYAYTIQSSLGGTIASGSAMEGDTYSVSGLPYAIMSNNVCYVLDDSNVSNYGETFTMGTADATNTINYTKSSDIKYFFEAESILSKSYGNGTGNYSGGTTAGVYSGATLTTSQIISGTYTVTANSSVRRSGEDAFTVQTSTDGTTWTDAGTITLTDSKAGSYSLEGVTLSSAGYIRLVESKSQNMCHRIDYVLLTRTGGNEIVGALDKSTAYRGAKGSDITLSKGDTYYVKFQNHGSTGQAWYNWLLDITSGTDLVTTLRADWYAFGVGTFTDGYTFSTDGGATKSTGSVWDTFSTDMQDATVELTLAYSSDGVLTVKGTATKGTDIYYYDYSVSNYTPTGGSETALADNVTLNLSVENAWLEVLEAHKPYTATFTETNGKTPTVTIYSDEARTTAVTNGTLADGTTYYYTATLGTDSEYADYNGEFTVSSTGTTVTFTMEQKPTYIVTVNAVDASNNVIKAITTVADVYDGKSITYAYPAYIHKNGVLYYKANNTSGDYWRSTVTASGATESVTYTTSDIENVLYYTEAENLTGVTVASSYTNRASYGRMGYTSSADTYKDVVYLPAGTYKIHARGVNGNSATRTCNFKVGDEVKYAFSITNGTNIIGTSDEFTLTSGGELSFACDGSSTSGCDYFYITGTPTNTVVGALDCTTGYATKWNNTPVYIKNGETAYYKFVNYNQGPASANYNNWNLWVANSSSENKTILRADNYANLGDGTITDNDYKNVTYNTDLNGATVELSVKYLNGTLTCTAKTTKADGTTLADYIYTQTGYTDEQLKAYVSVDNSWLEILEQGVVANLSISSLGWGTFIAPFDCAIPDGVTAYTPTISDGKLVKGEGTKDTFVANTPYLVKSESAISKTYYGITTNDETTLFKKNALVGNVGAATVVEANAGNYLLQYNNSKLGFYKVATTGLKVGTNRCYLTTATSQEAKADVFLLFDDDDIPTSASAIDANANSNGVRKYVKNGQIFIETANGTFSATGTRVK